MNTPTFARNHIRLLVIAGLIIATAAGIIIGRSIGTGTDDAGLPVEDPAGEQAAIWTCSMHPQIRLAEPGQCPICGMDLIPVETSTHDNTLGARQLHLSPAAEKLAGIRVATVERRFVDSPVAAVGTVTFDEGRVERISSWVGGRIDRLYVDYTGSPVRTGDPLIDIYSPELYSAQEEYLQAIRTDGELSGSTLGSVSRTARLTVEASREKLRLLGMSAGQLASIAKNGRPDEHVTIVSPSGGVVIHKNATAGMYVTTGDPVYTLADPSHVWAMLAVYETDLPWLRLGQDVTFTVEAWPGTSFTGRIAFIDPVVDPRSRTVRVRLDVPNEDLRLKPDMFVKATVRARPADNTTPPLVIPRSAPLITGKRAVVYVQLGTPGVYEGREVVLGPRAGDWYQVAEGLAEGEKVVVNGNFRIDSALQILAKPSMMNPEGGAAPPVHDHGGMTMGAVAMAAELPASPTAGAGHDMAAMEGTSEQFTGQLGDVYRAYFAIQSALSHDDPDSARTAAAGLLASLDGVDMTLLGHDDHLAWMKLLGGLSTSATTITGARAIADIRTAFKPLSDAMIAVAARFGQGTSPVLYRFHCPMAFDNAGADWLQNTKVLENPFFGSAMFSCGSLVEEFAK